MDHFNRIIPGDNLRALADLPDHCARLIYIDPPFNTGRAQKRDRVSVVHDANGSRVGFAGKRYRQTSVQAHDVAANRYADSFDDYITYLMERIKAALHCLTPDGSIFIHLDAREVHYAKVAMDGLLGRACFMNEIIWAYDFGGRSKKRWPSKHDTILWYVLDPDNYVFNFDAIDRIPYLAPSLVTPEKARRGKTPTDVWWQTIVPTNSAEKTGYPTQKPLPILRRIVRVHSDPGDCVLDFFAGSGTTGHAAALEDRRFVLIDENPHAVEVMGKRLSAYQPVVEKDDEPANTR